ncbi:MAG TPA: carboxypeptidase regulatory-like domain-containing protein [Bacillota bacterium]
MHNRFLLIMIIIIIVSGCGGRSGNNSSTLSYQSSTISGTVIDGTVHTPISGVRISVSNSREGIMATAVSDQNGNFTTSQFIVTAQSYDISFSKENYLTKTYLSMGLSSGSYKFPYNIELQTGFAGSGIPPSIIQDVALTNGKGEIIIAANKEVETLVAIPYNTALANSNFTTRLTITTDVISSATYNLSMRETSQKEPQKDLMAAIRKRQSQLLQVLRSAGKLRTTNNILKNSQENSFKDGPASLSFNKYYNYGWKSVEAVKVYPSSFNSKSRCVIYKDINAQGTHLNSEYINELGKAFDGYYEILTSYFGSPDKIDIDSNRTIYILLTELDNDSNGLFISGYFDSTHEHKNDELNKISNEKEMIFISTYKPPGWDDSEWLNLIKGTLAHEFTHLIYFNNRYHIPSADIFGSETWINEGLAMVAEDIAVAGPGRHFNGLDMQRINPYLYDTANNSLCTWGDSFYDYPPAYMFMRYFADRYGENSLKTLIQSPYTGVEMLKSVTATSLDELIRDWLTAVILDRIGYHSDDIQFNNDCLYYKTLELSDPKYAMNTKNTGVQLIIPDSAGAFIKLSNLSGSSQINVSMEGDPQLKLRLIMLPVNGIRFSLTKQTVNLIKVR